MKRNKTILSLIIFAIVIVGIITIAFFAKKGGQPTSNENNKISLRLSWVPDASVAPVLAAKEKGYFEKEGLDVTINSGGPDVNPINILVSGSDDIAIAPSDAQVLQSIAQGVPLKMIGVLWYNPVAFVAKTNSGINRPKDFEGRKVSNYLYSPHTIRVLEEMVRKDGGDISKVIVEPLDFTYRTFIDNQVDVANVYLSDQLNTLRSQGIDLKVFVGADYGVNHYGGPFIVTEKTYNEQKNTIRKFLKAVIEGKKFVEFNPEEAADIVMKYNDQYTKESLIGNFSDIQKYHIYADGFKIDESTIKENYDWLVAKKQIEKEIDYKKSFDNSLLPD